MFNFSPQTLIALAVILFVAFPVHELAHAYTADALGDDTPRRSGRLTLNPLAHLDVMGTLLLVVTRSFGWAKPVPINPYALSRRSPAAVMWVSLAGPFSNLVMAILAAIPWRLGLVSFSAVPNSAEFWAASILYEFIIINLGLMLFNLIPIAPLDGEKVLEYFLPASMARTWDTIRPYGPVILLVVLFVGPLLGFDILGTVMGPPLRSLLGLLIGVRV
jgi:Zn-dependent protease